MITDSTVTKHATSYIAHFNTNLPKLIPPLPDVSPRPKSSLVSRPKLRLVGHIVKKGSSEVCAVLALVADPPFFNCMIHHQYWAALWPGALIVLCVCFVFENG